MIVFFSVVALAGAALVYLDRAAKVPDSIPAWMAGRSSQGWKMVVVGIFGAFCAWALP